MSTFITCVSVWRMDISDRWTLSTETLVCCNSRREAPTLNSCAGAPRGNSEAVSLVGHLFGWKLRAPTRWWKRLTHLIVPQIYVCVRNDLLPWICFPSVVLCWPHVRVQFTFKNAVRCFVCIFLARWTMQTCLNSCFFPPLYIIKEVSDLVTLFCLRSIQNLSFRFHEWRIACE